MPISFKNRRTTKGKISDEDSSSSVIASNFDLLRQILLCLPVKSLLIFKSVSKQWFSFISNPSFIHNHYLQNCLSTHGLILREWSFSGRDPPEYEFVFLDGRSTTNGVPFKTLTFDNKPAGINIEQSCNGLLCCRSFRYYDSERTYYIYNPSTKHYKTLPTSAFMKNEFCWVCSVSLAFDPLESPDYEAICIWATDDADKFPIAIYSSRTDSWRLSGDVFRAQKSESGVFWNGSLHWFDLGSKSGVYFDIGKDIVQKMPLPSIPDEYGASWRFIYFGECRGHLHLVNTHGPSTASFDILEMDTNYTGWTVKYIVDLDGLVIAYPEMIHDRFEFSVMLVEETEGSSKLVLQIRNNMDIISYDLKDLSFKKIHGLSLALNSECSKRYGYYAYQHIETLTCV